MGGSQPFLYDTVTADSQYDSFDPKAVSRAGLTPKPAKPKQDGPLISFNQHPDSYLILPPGNTTAKPMKASIKKRISQTRVVQLIFRCIELLGAIGLLVVAILLTDISVTTVWIMRIPPGVCILHTIYAIYHLKRRPSGRTPASSASYMLFASAFDAAIIPFYVFTALVTEAQYKLAQGGTGIAGEWSSLLSSGQKRIPVLSGTAFLCAVISGGFHLISLGIGLWLAITFRKIARLPPDMNPLEDHLTSRHHKRNKSSISTMTQSERRLSEPLESKRNSGAPYEDVSRPPTLPFLSTRVNSSAESISTYHNTPPASRDPRNDLPSRQYQIQTSLSNSPHSSISSLKRASIHPPAKSPKRASYMEIPLSETSSVNSSQHIGNLREAWYTADSLPARDIRNTPSPTKSRGSYQALDNDGEGYLSMSPYRPAIDPLGAHPLSTGSPRRSKQLTGNSALSEISLNASNTPSLTHGSDDLYDLDEVKPKKSAPPVSTVQDNFKARYYGDLRAATPPVLVGAGINSLAVDNGHKHGRQVSSGNDYTSRRKSGVFGRRDVSGKIAEEGRGGGWGPRFRKASGLGGKPVPA